LALAALALAVFGANDSYPKFPLTISQNRVHDKILVQESLPAVPVSLEDEEVSVACHISADGSDGLWVEGFGRRPLLGFAPFAVLQSKPN